MVLRVQEAINEQVNNELSSSYSYLAMSAFCESQNFRGCAKWFRMQSEEETGHAMKLFDFLIARGANVTLDAISRPAPTYKSIAQAFETALKQEIEVSRQIDHLYELAFREKAFSAMAELNWFLTEQVEEERQVREIVAKFNLVKNDAAALLEIDKELGARSAEAK
ncbi:MAG: ferritin [Planctomycetes bacterium]|nr:ferritin [Planctomycetota bacterium]